MTISRRTIIARTVLVTLIISFLVATTSCARYSEDSARHRHRHRHDASTAIGRRNHEIAAGTRRSPWPQQDDDYEDAFDLEEDDDADGDEVDDDYDVERLNSRTYDRNFQSSRSPQRNYHSRFEPRYSLRHHGAAQHHGNPWYRGGSDEDAERRRNARYGGVSGGRGHRLHGGRDRSYHDERRRLVNNPSSGYPSRIYDYYDDSEEDNDDDDDSDRDNSYDRSSKRWRMDDIPDENSQEYRTIGSASTRRRNSRRHRTFEHHEAAIESKGHRGRQDTRRNDWKSRTSISGISPLVPSVTSVQRNDDDDWMEKRRKIGTHRGGKGKRRLPIDETIGDDGDRNEDEESRRKKSRNNIIDRGEERKRDDLEDRDFDDDTVTDGETKKSDKRREEEEKEEEEENIWNDAEDNNEDIDDDNDEAFDNTNYYKSEDEPPYKTFDDIIKSLTSEDPTTPKPTVRRDYRNVGIERYLRKDAYGNIYDSRNATIARDTFAFGRNQNSNNHANKWRFHTRKPDITNYSNAKENKKFSNSIGETPTWRGNRENERKKVHAKLNDLTTRTKSLEQEYDEDYENSEKDEDVMKIGGVEQVTEMQADITNMEYADEENETETEDETSAPLATSPPTTTTTTTSTTTTPKPIATTTLAPREPYDRRDSRSYETSNVPQNGLQQTANGGQKWQSSNTRDGSKDSKGHGQQNSKNGKSAEIKEALQHAIKVSREGSCQWPRARVIPVREVYPSPSTTYIPHCAILHRCSDDTGCCRSEALTCVPKVSHRVELYFYSTSVGGSSVVEKLSFYNHTECECKERSDYGASSDKTIVTNDHRFTRHHLPATSPPQNIRRPPQRKPCKCPSEFTPRITPEGECQCNCFENDQNCIRTRRGKGYFSLRDRLCIQNEECATPFCEFGEYMRRQGKCPRKKDKFDDIARYPTNLHHRFRS